MKTLLQDQVWTEGGRIVPLEDLDPDHRANLIPYLRRNARPFHIVTTGADASPAEAEEWLEQTPLMRRLVDMEKGRSIDQRRATHQRNQAYEAATGYEKIRIEVGPEVGP